MSSQRGTPPQASSTPSTPTTPLSSHAGSHPCSSTPATPTPTNYLTGGVGAPSSTPNTPPTPFSSQHQGPQPISPPPLPPQISAAELSLLTEASATKNGTFQCTLCSKQFGYKNGLIRHVRLTHVGEKPYQCNICNRRFGYKHILTEHQNLHFGNRPYACNLCDKRFAARSNLIQHRMVHKRPFNCTLCQKRFDREDQLKKHLFAHPQSLLVCAVCKYAGANQLDISRHMLEAHRLHGSDPRSPGYAGPEDDSNRGMCGGGGGGLMDTSTTPDSSEDHLLPMSSCSASRYPMDSRGHRIDAICSQLSTSVASSGYPNHLHHLQSGPYHGVVVKKEMVDTTDGFGEEKEDRQVTLGSEAGSSAHHHHRLYLSPGASSSVSGLSASVDPLLWTFPAAAGRYPGGPVSSFDVKGPTTGEGIKQGPAPQASAALPGIHEVFSRRGHQKLPPFANFMPVPMKMNLPLPDLSLSMLQSPPPAPVVSTAPPSTSSVGSLSVNPTPPQQQQQQQQRPTAQLPPIAHHSMRQTKDQASQHTLSIAGFPSLDDVLSYYISQGRLFKCQHCNILFFERGMYFLHASLHGLTSPWECSICHKVCSDKNEFTLHFVNQQHNS